MSKIKPSEYGVAFGNKITVGKSRLMDELSKLDNEQVNHPKHYNSHPSGIECIDVTRHMSFNLGNAIKYIWRADEKGNGIQDLEKAKWYIIDEIQRRLEENE